MSIVSAYPTPYEYLELRDGIFFYRKLSRRGGALVLAAPKCCVEVAHRAEHRRIRKRHDAAVFLCCLLLVAALLDAMLYPTVSALLQVAGIGGLVFLFFSTSVIHWPLKSGICQTEIGVTTDRRSIRIVFSRAQGHDAGLELLLDHLQRFEPDQDAPTVRGCAVELAESWGKRLKYLGYALGSLILGIGILINDEDPELLGYACLFASAGIVLRLIVSSAINHSFTDSMRAARGALLEGDFDTAALVLNKVLEKKPYHPYANYLMTAHALATGDLDAAEHHRAAMNGPTGRERLGVIAIDFAHTVSSEPAFRRLAAYAHGDGQAGAETLSRVSP